MASGKVKGFKSIEAKYFEVPNNGTANIVSNYVARRITAIMMCSSSGSAWISQYILSFVATGNSRAVTVKAPDAGGITVTNQDHVIKVTNTTGYGLPFVIWGEGVDYLSVST